MLPLRKRLDIHAKAAQLRLDIIQQDYLLTWLLKGISEHSSLKDSLIFKGGTALKKCYFNQYRFSEDLDFTALPSSPKHQDLETAVKEVCTRVQTEIQTYAPVSLFCERYAERQPHPHGQEAFAIRGQFPWQREPLTKIMIEVTANEKILTPPRSQPILHEYEESIEGSLKVYSLEEVVLEKMRAILQQTRKLHERKWARSRVRDYYDLWRILCNRHNTIDLQGVATLLKRKCAGKGVEFTTVEDFVQPVMVGNIHQSWNQWLGYLIAELPSVDVVLADVRQQIERLLE